MQEMTIDGFVKDSYKDIILSLIEINKGYLTIEILNNFDLNKSNVDELVSDGTIKEIDIDKYEIVHK